MIFDEEVQIINNVYLVHLDGTNGYSLSRKFKPNLYETILSEDVVELKGDLCAKLQTGNLFLIGQKNS